MIDITLSAADYAKLIAIDLIKNGMSEDEYIIVDSSDVYIKSISYDKDEQKFVFENFRACNFVDGHDDWVEPNHLATYLEMKLTLEQLVKIRKDRNIIWEG